MTPDEYSNLIKQSEYYMLMAREALDMVIEINKVLVESNRKDIKLVVNNEN